MDSIQKLTEFCNELSSSVDTSIPVLQKIIPNCKVDDTLLKILIDYLEKHEVEISQQTIDSKVKEEQDKLFTNQIKQCSKEL